MSCGPQRPSMNGCCTGHEDRKVGQPTAPAGQRARRKDSVASTGSERILVTGASGFIGRATLDDLRRSGLRARRSEERRVGQEGVSRVRARLSAFTEKNNINKTK